MALRLAGASVQTPQVWVLLVLAVLTVLMALMVLLSQ
jgi:hypothetical protein